MLHSSTGKNSTPAVEGLVVIVVGTVAVLITELELDGIVINEVGGSIGVELLPLIVVLAVVVVVVAVVVVVGAAVVVVVGVIVGGIVGGGVIVGGIVGGGAIVVAFVGRIVVVVVVVVVAVVAVVAAVVGCNIGVGTPCTITIVAGGFEGNKPKQAVSSHRHIATSNPTTL